MLSRFFVRLVEYIPSPSFCENRFVQFSLETTSHVIKDLDQCNINDPVDVRSSGH